MKYSLPAIFVAVVLFLAFLVVTGLTVLPIERQEHKGDVTYVGGEYSNADVMYIDHRPALKKRGTPSDVWWETTDGEWRRLEYISYYHGTGTVVVLRDVAFGGSRFGISRNSRTANYFQAKLDAVRIAYHGQSFFDRVWVWRVYEFR